MQSTSDEPVPHHTLTFLHSFRLSSTHTRPASLPFSWHAQRSQQSHFTSGVYRCANEI